MTSSRVTLTLTLALMLTGTPYYSYVSAETLCSYPGPDMSPDGLTLKDFFVEAIEAPEIGEFFLISFILSSSPENPRITFTEKGVFIACLLYTSPSPRDRQRSRMPSSA